MAPRRSKEASKKREPPPSAADHRAADRRAAPRGPVNECPDPLRAAAFHTGNDGVFQNNWGDVLCFPYTLCIKFWECCAALCAGTNYCMIYWLILQWIMCKVTQVTTPHPVVYPYFFNIFFQIFGLTCVFGGIWCKYAKTIFIPYFNAYWSALLEVHYGPIAARQNVTRLSYRKYCFRKFEIFEVPTSNTNNGPRILVNYSLLFVVTAFNYFVPKIFN